MLKQVVYDFKAEGGIPKLIANKVTYNADTAWLLPFWRAADRWNAPWTCNQAMKLSGVAGALLSEDEVPMGSIY